MLKKIVNNYGHVWESSDDNLENRLDEYINVPEFQFDGLIEACDKVNIVGIDKASGPDQTVMVVRGPGKYEVYQQFEHAYNLIREQKAYVPHLNPLDDYIEMGKRVHALPDLIRCAKNLIEKEGGDYYKGLANGFICAWNIIMDEDVKYVSVDSAVGHKCVKLDIKTFGGYVDNIVIPAPLTQTEGEQRMNEFDL